MLNNLNLLLVSIDSRICLRIDQPSSASPLPRFHLIIRELQSHRQTHDINTKPRVCEVEKHPLPAVVLRRPPTAVVARCEIVV